jgi:hypothetical protein
VCVCVCVCVCVLKNKYQLIITIVRITIGQLKKYNSKNVDY